MRIGRSARERRELAKGRALSRQYAAEHARLNTVKCLTVWEPWASLIALSCKDVENRVWTTAYRGPLLIHAGQSFMEQGDKVSDAERITRCWREWRAHYTSLPAAPQFGLVVAVTRLADCLPSWKCRSVWAEGPQCLVLRETQALEHPFRLTGKQRLFNVDLATVPHAAVREIRDFVERDRALCEADGG